VTTVVFCFPKNEAQQLGLPRLDAIRPARHRQAQALAGGGTREHCDQAV